MKLQWLKERFCAWFGHKFVITRQIYDKQGMVTRDNLKGEQSRCKRCGCTTEWGDLYHTSLGPNGEEHFPLSGNGITIEWQEAPVKQIPIAADPFNL